MKIVNIVPGFGGTFYCGNCLRDSVYVNSLREMGHDAITLPMYLPSPSRGETTDADVRFSMVQSIIYLKQQFPLFQAHARMDGAHVGFKAGVEICNQEIRVHQGVWAGKNSRSRCFWKKRPSES